MFKMHFLNVGHGDCTIIDHFSGRLSMVDINNGTDLDAKSAFEMAEYFGISEQQMQIQEMFEESYKSILIEKGYQITLTNPIEFLAENYSGKSLFRYIQTHPHLDHMRGLSALNNQNFEIMNFWDTEHEFVPDFQNDNDENEWNEYERLRSSNESPKVLHIKEGSTGVYYNEDSDGIAGGDGIEILSPNQEILNQANEDENPNILSYVLRVTVAGIKVILGGDAECKVWEEIAETYGDELKCDVLKASHHGRKSGFCDEAVKLMSPTYTIVSVGKKPNTDASNNYRKYSDNVWSTRWRGNISLEVDSYGNWDLNPQFDR